MIYYISMAKTMGNFFYLCRQETSEYWYLSQTKQFAEKFLHKGDAISSYQEFLTKRGKEPNIQGLFLVKVKDEDTFVGC